VRNEWRDRCKANVGLKPTRTKANRTKTRRTKAHMDKSPQVWVKSPHCSLITERQQLNASCANYLPSFTAVFLHPASRVFWTLLWLLKTGAHVYLKSPRQCHRGNGNSKESSRSTTKETCQACNDPAAGTSAENLPRSCDECEICCGDIECCCAHDSLSVVSETGYVNENWIGCNTNASCLDISLH